MGTNPQLSAAVEAATVEYAGAGVICGDSLVLCEVMDSEGNVGFISLTEISSRHAEMMLQVLGHMAAAGSFPHRGEGTGTSDAV